MSIETVYIDQIVIGGGIMGLSLARQCIENRKSVAILEKNSILMNETSSRNSEVMHAGIYYPANSLKTIMCIKGRKMLSQYLSDHNIKSKQIGKIIFAGSKSEIPSLEKLYNNSMANDVPLEMVPASVKHDYSNICMMEEAVYSPLTRIFDSHQFAQSLKDQITDGGGYILTSATASIKDHTNEFIILKVVQRNEEYIIKTQKVFNCAGNGALEFLKKSFVVVEGFEEFPVKGHYFDYNGTINTEKLLYPMPKNGGLGVHLTLDLGGNIKFGPDTQIASPEHSYEQTVDALVFHQAVKENFLNVESKNLRFSYAGIRPKIRYRGNIVSDFLIRKDLGGKLISMLGIESPGLTASLALAEYAFEI